MKKQIIRTLITFLLPPRHWQAPVAILLGLFSGLILYAVYISKAESYLGDKPETCINCHVMNPQYANWAHSAHRRITNCNDCHVPHDNFFHKYYFKAQDGLRHATIYTLHTEPQVIFIREAGREVVQKNCLRCHEQTVGMEFMMPVQPNFHTCLKERSCLDCHRETPHGRVNGLSSTPNALVKTRIESRTERDDDD